MYKDFDFDEIINGINNLIYTYLPKNKTNIFVTNKSNFLIIKIQSNIIKEYYYDLVLINDDELRDIHKYVFFILKIDNTTNQVVDNKYCRDFLHLFDKSDALEKINELLTKCFKNVYKDSFSSKWFSVYDEIKEFCKKYLDHNIVKIDTHCYDEYRFLINICFKEIFIPTYGFHIDVRYEDNKIRYFYDGHYRHYFSGNNLSFSEDRVSIDLLYSKLIDVIVKCVETIINDRYIFSDKINELILKNKRQNKGVKDYIDKFIENKKDLLFGGE